MRLYARALRADPGLVSAAASAGAALRGMRQCGQSERCCEAGVRLFFRCRCWQQAPRRMKACKAASAQFEVRPLVIQVHPNAVETELLVADQEQTAIHLLKILLMGAGRIDRENVLGETALFDACRAGWCPGVREVLLDGASLVWINRGCVSPLMVAAARGSVDGVQELCLHASAGLSKPDQALWETQAACALIHAARNGHAAVCLELIRRLPHLRQLSGVTCSSLWFRNAAANGVEASRGPNICVGGIACSNDATRSPSTSPWCRPGRLAPTQRCDNGHVTVGTRR